MANEPKGLRCAIYTRKSTEHGLDQEFNSLDAQRDACEAYIKSQSSLGWQALPQHYDDPAYSGGNLERPALKKLLADIERDKVDVVVVYKIDRLTRSLADFAKLVEAFDARSMSFVAVTQQFNTTTSMGRLTLNVLLSFAQFERELSSERVRDKVAASRRKGKWTGGTVPLGYDACDKKLVVNKIEAETVRTIFSRYLELQSFSKLIAELDGNGIVTKLRDTKVPKYNGGIPFTYGPLAYSLKNRFYLGEIGHGGEWFEGEHEAIIDRDTFDKVQQQLKTNASRRKAKRSKSGALLIGKLYDSSDNLMSPSYSIKNGVRYRFYVSSALLRGRKNQAGSIPRVAAQEIESRVIAALRDRSLPDSSIDDAELINQQLATARFGNDDLTLFLHQRNQQLKGSDRVARDDSDRGLRIRLPWSVSQLKNIASIVDPASTRPREPDQKLGRALVRAHYWIELLSAGIHKSVGELAASVKLNPKVIRNELKLAFLAPQITESALAGYPEWGLPQLRKLAALSWRQQVAELPTTSVE
jgi:site-specific DNA recombinase